MEYTHHYLSPLGGITMASDGNALTGLWFEGQQHFAYTLDPNHQEKNLPIFEQTDRWLDLYFSGKDPAFTPPLSIKATPFRQMVWQILLTIPYGQTMTYGEIASMIAARKGTAIKTSAEQGTAKQAIPRMSAQAVGGAVGHNPISLIIPCHRVIGTNGTLVGYGGGLDRKAALLALEQNGRTSRS